MSDFREKKFDQGKQMLPLASTILMAGAFWYAWARYDSRLNWPDPQWYGWVQLALITALGSLCLLATLLFIFGKPSGWSVFQAGLSIVPLVLFLNLVILVFRVVHNMVQGNATILWERLSASPQKLLFIVLVLIALGLLGSPKERDTRS